MLTIADLLRAVAPPLGFTVTVVKDTVTIDKVVWYDAEGEKRVTEECVMTVNRTFNIPAGN